MNKSRRKKLADICMKLTDIKAEIEQIQQDEEQAFENMPESLQQSGKGQQSEEAKDTIADAASELDSIIDSLQSL